MTGVAGTGEDEEREKFESSFPDLSDEAGYEVVSTSPDLRQDIYVR